MAKLPIVADYMARFTHSLRPEMDIYDAVDFLLERRVTGAPVVDVEGRLVGLLSEKGCLKLFSEGAEAGLPRGTVRDFMTKDFTRVEPTMDIYYAAGLFLREEERRFPVVDKDGKLQGEITRFDILRAVKSLLR